MEGWEAGWGGAEGTAVGSIVCRTDKRRRKRDTLPVLDSATDNLLELLQIDNWRKTVTCNLSEDSADREFGSINVE